MNKIGSTKLSLSRKPRIEKIVAAKGKKKIKFVRQKGSILLSHSLRTRKFERSQKYKVYLPHLKTYISKQAMRKDLLML